MWEGYANAVAEFDKAHSEVSIEVVVDRFHVAKNYRECVDHLRKQECRRFKKELSEAEYAEIQGVLWPIRKNRADLTDEEHKKLNRLFEYSSELKLALYLPRRTYFHIRDATDQRRSQTTITCMAGKNLSECLNLFWQVLDNAQ